MPDTDIAIRVQNLSKRYRIGLEDESHDTFAATLADFVKRPGKNLQRLSRLTRFGDDDSDAADIIWALKDISFEVKRGEVLGIIGRNGAGKSTLLKILARITHPSSGRIELRGRVSSLLEVGTGFHPELTGRENVYLNGTILGMRKTEIDRKFDEIVDFSGVEKFIDTPVKRYSSGMRVRLAFSVAAHLEPEILLIDEVLSVGDASFQKKCLGKMSEMATGGRTVLFVSHNMAAVKNLCERGILMQNGRICDDDYVTNVISFYARSVEDNRNRELADRPARQDAGRVHLVKVEILNSQSVPTNNLTFGETARFIFTVSRFQARLNCVFSIYDQQAQLLASFNSSKIGPEDVIDFNQKSTLACELLDILLIPGHYRINVALSVNDEIQDHVEGAAFFEVLPGYLQGRLVSQTRYGVIQLPHRWM